MANHQAYDTVGLPVAKPMGVNGNLKTEMQEASSSAEKSS